MTDGVLDAVNPAYTAADFRAAMPQFSTACAPDGLVQAYVTQAHAVVRQSRWHELWREGMRLYVAHFLTLYLRDLPQDSSLAALVASGEARGAVTGETVGEISATYAAPKEADGLKGWGVWGQTSYGRQFATLSRTLARGGLYVL